jgi:transposase
MGKRLVTDELWEAIEPLLPEEPPKKSKGGRPRVPDRAALTGIIFVLKSGIPWEMLPQEMGCGSGSTCWRRLHESGRRPGGMAPPTPAAFRAAGGGQRDRLGASLAGLGERARQKGGEKTGKNPTDRGKPGSKRHLISERRGVPLAVVCSPAPTSTTPTSSRNWWRLSSRSSAPAEDGQGSAPRNFTPTQGLRGQEVPPSSEEARHQEPHSQEGQRQQRAAGATSVGGVERTLAWVSR